jgi:hypothetical protein
MLAGINVLSKSQITAITVWGKNDSCCATDARVGQSSFEVRPGSRVRSRYGKGHCEEPFCKRPTAPAVPLSALWGPGSGLTVSLSSLDEYIKVFRNGGPAFGVPVDEPDPSDSDLIGVYEMAAPLGPETPIYVPAATETALRRSF